MNSAVYSGTLMHNRIKPRKHRFTYEVASWLFDLDELDSLDKRLTFFSRNRFNLVSFYDADYGDGTETPLRTYIHTLLDKQGIENPDSVSLLCYPRILGYVFNSFAVYFCYDASKRVIAVVYEVSNTFGERHSYVIAAKDQGNGVIRQWAEKKLHVSPFFETDGCAYQFRVSAPAEQVTLGISLFKQGERLFSAVLQGEQRPISDRFIAKQLITLPLMTVKVVAAIHWQALKLWIKGMTLFRHTSRGYFFSWSAGENQSKTTRATLSESRKGSL